MVSTEKDTATIVDSLTTVDVGGRQTIRPIAEAAREAQGENPAMQAAELLSEAVDPGDTVLVLTGFLIPPTMVQETDGPLGAVSIARAIDAGLDANPIIACEPQAVEICERTAEAGGLSVLDRETSFKGKRSVTVEAFPADREEAKAYADDVIESLDPSAVVSVEKVGTNSAGEYHNMAGYNITDSTAKVDELYPRLGDTPTVSVGDAGNEVGMGKVAETVRREIEYGETCQCDCGEGIAETTETDVLVPAAVSNWGGHAITACLSVLVGRPLLHDPAVERRMLVEASTAGSIDGIAGGTTAWCDGMPPGAHESIVLLLQEALGSSVHQRGGGELQR